MKWGKGLINIDLTIWVDGGCEVYFIVDYNVSYIHRGNDSDIIHYVLCLGGVVSREGQVNICHYTAVSEPYYFAFDIVTRQPPEIHGQLFREKKKKKRKPYHSQLVTTVCITDISAKKKKKSIIFVFTYHLSIIFYYTGWAIFVREENQLVVLFQYPGYLTSFHLVYMQFVCNNNFVKLSFVLLTI